MKKVCVALIFMFSPSLFFGKEVVTNPLRNDGFGAQFQSVIMAAIYAELHDMEFVYSPFSTMEHNYDNDPSYLEKKEDLINFIGNFEINRDVALQSKFTPYDLVNFFDANMPSCLNTLALKKIKRIFRENKDRAAYFNTDSFNVAVHVRRPNLHDSRVSGTDTPDEVYLRIIDSLRNVYKSEQPVFHIYSQGLMDAFASYMASDVVLHLNDSLEFTFSSMVLADVLVTTASSLSYSAGILSDGIIHYIPFWHPPLPHWNVINSPDVSNALNHFSGFRGLTYCVSEEPSVARIDES
jgi:hypothetical protein